jgi:hypothetical protein
MEVETTYIIFMIEKLPSFSREKEDKLDKQIMRFISKENYAFIKNFIK